MRGLVFLFGMVLTTHLAPCQDFIGSVPSSIRFSAVLDDAVSSLATTDVTGTSPGVKFKFDHVELLDNSTANFVVLSPSSGIIPTLVHVGLNESVVRKMTPGIHSLVIDFSTVDHSPASHARLGVTLNLSAPSTPNIQTAVNTASYLSSLSPGAMVSIFGTHLGRQPGASAPYSEFGLYPTDLSDTAVTFNGIAAPLLYVGPSQINALVPYGLAGQKTANVVVTRFPGLTSQSSNAFTIPIADTSPAIFTSTSNGRGQGTFLLYPDSSYNSPDNPAPPGSAVTLFATGAGVWSPSVPDGAINLENYALPPNLPWFNTRPVSLTIGGKAARLIYTGGVLYQVWGLLQINAIIPEGIASGPQPVILTIGQNSNADQKITIAIK